MLSRSSGRISCKDLSRRSFIKTSAASGLALALGSRAASAKSDTLKVGFVSPRTGPLAGFGETDGYVLDVLRKSLNGAFTASGRTFDVEILDRDTQSDPSRAAQLAKDLINNQAVDLMLAISTPDTINPVADACEASGVPCLSTVMPWEAWYFGRGAKPGQPSPFKWSYHFGFGTQQFLNSYVSQWNLLETNRKVGVMLPNDADGNAVRAGLVPMLAGKGYGITDPGAYENGTSDYSSQISQFKREGIEIFANWPIPPDFAVFWRQAVQQGLTRQIKIAQISKTGLFPAQIEALGDLGNKLASACYWHRAFPYSSSLTGLSGAELADGYEAESGRQWTQQLGATMSLFDAGFAALKASADPKDKSAVASALSTLKADTMSGVVDFTSGPVPNVAIGPLIGTQWVLSKEGSKFKFDYVVTENANDSNVPVSASILPYNS